MSQNAVPPTPWTIPPPPPPPQALMAAPPVPPPAPPRRDKPDEQQRSPLWRVAHWLRRWWLLLVAIFIVVWLVTQYVSPRASLSSLAIILQLGVAVLLGILPFAAIFWFLGRPRLYWVMPGDSGTGFADYKGNPEVLEAARRIVTLLRGVKHFKQMGGEISRGIVLIGPPGTGKSYLAQCISTEANVPFAYTSAASFRAMFIGMDVLMIKNLYRKARRLARQYGGCIIFMDEFDAIGLSRSGMHGNQMGMAGGFGFMGGTGGLNELLRQMDPPPPDNSFGKKLMRVLGFPTLSNQREPVLTIGATNIPDQLDPALLRPGYFDRKIIVAPPSDANRGEVIEYYLSKVAHDDIALNKLVSDMIGYTPVSIKYVINEAVVLAHFAGRDAITYKDICEAREMHEHGLRHPRALAPLEKRRLAYHEAGHAIAQVKLLPRCRATHITIAKRLDSGGEAFVSYKPHEEIVTQSADEVFADIQTLLASRASEELFLQTRLNNVEGDLHRATQLALHYVAHWGMGEGFFSAAATLAPERIYTDPALRREAEELLRRAYTEVRDLLDQHRAAVVAVAEALIEREDLNHDEIIDLIEEAETPPIITIAQAALARVAPISADHADNNHVSDAVVDGDALISDPSQPQTGN
jgi:cell division protease FtsH